MLLAKVSFLFYKKMLEKEELIANTIEKSDYFYDAVAHDCEYIFVYRRGIIFGRKRG